MGSYRHTVDHKGRLNVPAKFRKHIAPDMDEALIVTKGLDGCLFAYPHDEWELVKGRLRDLPVTQKLTRRFMRMFMSVAVAVSVDKQGRIGLPKSLLDAAGIDAEVLLIGTIDHFEIWDPVVYQESMDEDSSSFEEVAESILL